MICKLQRLIKENMVEFLFRFPKSEVMLNKYVMFFFEEITKWIEEGLPVDIIYLDFQKVFEKVPHKRLLFK